ncbi:MAG TPA: fatty acid desaturase [Kofleriaceae bacterium]|nr:fatty acid desaturase [Kofleriaceae bacterium]
MTHRDRSETHRHRAELPTWIVIAAVYGGWLALTFSFHHLPAWLVAPLGAWLLAWHGSLQHEALHGHPTRRPRWNAIIAGPPLSLWLPFSIYRESHMAHHRARELTDPFEDPESSYTSSEEWARLPRPVRLFRRAQHTAAARLLLGPFAVVWRLLAGEARRIRSGEADRLAVWAAHAAAVSAVLFWVMDVCRIPLGAYLGLFVYPGLSLTLLRSFAEHRPGADQLRRTAVVEAGPVFSLLYLNNNLHVVHHLWPGLPWYELPRRYRAERGWLLERNGHFAFAGYAEVLRRYGLRARGSPVHHRPTGVAGPGDGNGGAPGRAPGEASPAGEAGA